MSGLSTKELILSTIKNGLYDFWEACTLRNALIFLFGIGSAFALGLLSFGGFYVIMPSLALAASALGLTTVYEAQVFVSNIKDALKKMSFTHIRKQLATKLLEEKLSVNKNNSNECQFFEDYRKQQKLVELYQKDNLDKETKKRKREAELKFERMRLWFSRLVFEKNNSGEKKSEYEQAVLDSFKQTELDDLRYTYKKHRIFYTIGGVIFVLTAGCVSLGTIYLFAGTVPLVPFLVGLAPTLAFPILTVSILAGIGYGYLVYNAVTDMVDNETIQKLWSYLKLKDGNGESCAAYLTISAALLLSLAAVLTVCTGGTWWVIAKRGGPVIQVFLSVVWSIGALIFNIENTSESIESIELLIEKSKNSLLGELVISFVGIVTFLAVVGVSILFAIPDLLIGKCNVNAYLNKHFYKPLGNAIKKARMILKSDWDSLCAKNNYGQIFNFFKFINGVIMFPVRFSLFLAHIAGNAFVEDRMPGMPAVAAITTSGSAELGEDIHYFDGKTEDIPTKFLRFVTWITLLKPLEILWEKFASGSTFKQAYCKVCNIKDKITIEAPDKDEDLEPSNKWQHMSKAMEVRDFRENHFGRSGLCRGRKVAQEKYDELTHLEKDIKKMPDKETKITIDSTRYETFAKQRYMLWGGG